MKKECCPSERREESADIGLSIPSRSLGPRDDSEQNLIPIDSSLQNKK